MQEKASQIYLSLGSTKTSEGAPNVCPPSLNPYKSVYDSYALRPIYIDTTNPHIVTISIVEIVTGYLQ